MSKKRLLKYFHCSHSLSKAKFMKTAPIAHYLSFSHRLLHSPAFAWVASLARDVRWTSTIAKVTRVSTTVSAKIRLATILAFARKVSTEGTASMPLTTALLPTVLITVHVKIPPGDSAVTARVGTWVNTVRWKLMSAAPTLATWVPPVSTA